MSAIHRGANVRFRRILVFAFLRLTRIGNLRRPRSPLPFGVVALRRAHFRRGPLRLRQYRHDVTRRIRVLFLVGGRNMVILLNGRVVVLPGLFLCL